MPQKSFRRVPGPHSREGGALRWRYRSPTPERVPWIFRRRSRVASNCDNRSGQTGIVRVNGLELKSKAS